MIRRSLILPFLLLLALAPIDVADTPTLLENVGKQVTVEGEIEQAQWSRSGKVMSIRFADAGEKGLMAALFEAQRDDFDKAFDGDVAKAMTGKRIRITGRLQLYGGRDEALKGRPEIILRNADDFEILDAEPTTLPTIRQTESDE